MDIGHHRAPLGQTTFLRNRESIGSHWQFSYKLFAGKIETTNTMKPLDVSFCKYYVKSICSRKILYLPQQNTREKGKCSTWPTFLWINSNFLSLIKELSLDSRGEFHFAVCTLRVDPPPTSDTTMMMEWNSEYVSKRSVDLATFPWKIFLL